MANILTKKPKKRPPVWETYNGQIASMRRQGHTLQAIGDTMGVTRERVRQIIKKHYETVERGKPASLFTTAEIIQLTGLPANTISYYHRGGVIKSTNASVKYPLYSMDALKAILDYRQCDICGKPIPTRRHTYCSSRCAKEGTRRSHSRCLWRIFCRKKGKPITPGIAYKVKGYG